MGDLSGLIDKIQDVIPINQQPDILDELTKGAFTLRLLYQMFQNLQNMGPLGQVSYPFFLNKFIACVLVISFRLH